MAKSSFEICTPVSVSLLLTLAAPGCLKGGEGDFRGCDFAESVSDEIKDPYTVTPEDILDVALGTWQGELAGEMFELGIAEHPNFGPMYGFRAMEDGSMEAVSVMEPECALVKVPVSVVASGSLEGMVGSSVFLRGLKLDTSSPDQEMAELEAHRIIVSMELQGADEDDPDSETDSFRQFILQPDGSMWALQGGQSTSVMKVGSRM